MDTKSHMVFMYSIVEFRSFTKEWIFLESRNKQAKKFHCIKIF